MSPFLKWLKKGFGHPKIYSTNVILIPVFSLLIFLCRNSQKMSSCFYKWDFSVIGLYLKIHTCRNKSSKICFKEVGGKIPLIEKISSKQVMFASTIEKSQDENDLHFEKYFELF